MLWSDPDNTLYFSCDFSPTAPIDPEARSSEAEELKAESLIDNSDMHVLDFSPTLKTLAMCSVLKHNLDQTLLPWGVQ